MYLSCTVQSKTQGLRSQTRTNGQRYSTGGVLYEYRTYVRVRTVGPNHPPMADAHHLPPTSTSWAPASPRGGGWPRAPSRAWAPRSLGWALHGEQKKKGCGSHPAATLPPPLFPPVYAQTTRPHDTHVYTVVIWRRDPANQLTYRYCSY